MKFAWYGFAVIGVLAGASCESAPSTPLPVVAPLSSAQAIQAHFVTIPEDALEMEFLAALHWLGFSTADGMNLPEGVKISAYHPVGRWVDLSFRKSHREVTVTVWTDPSDPWLARLLIRLVEHSLASRKTIFL